MQSSVWRHDSFSDVYFHIDAESSGHQQEAAAAATFRPPYDRMPDTGIQQPMPPISWPTMPVTSCRIDYPRHVGSSPPLPDALPVLSRRAFSKMKAARAGQFDLLFRSPRPSSIISRTGRVDKLRHFAHAEPIISIFPLFSDCWP